jgi:uncharacterized protein (TIGR03437 family)
LLLSIACGRASESDALAINANIQARHLPFGTILDPVFASGTSDQIVGYTRCGDSALWTGHYLAAEAFRFKVTGAPDGLANVKSAIAGIKGLLDVTGNNFLPRCMGLLASPYAAGIQREEKANGIYMASPWFWVGNTSRDQYAGVVFGLAVAYDMVDDAAVKSSINDLIIRVIEYPRGHNWVIQEPDRSMNPDFLVRPDFISAFLEVGRHINPVRFNGDTFFEKSLLTVPVDVPIGVDTGSDDSYFKFNLDYINLYNLVRLDPNTGNTDSRKAYAILRNHTAGHLNAFFDIIDRGLNGPNAGRDAETVALLEQWLLRPRRDFYVDVSNSVKVCNANGKNQACDPIPVPLRPPTDFLWQRSPFQLNGGAIGTIETAGIDYVLPYWMARFYGVVTGAHVQSAAAASAAVAADSIASLYGSNLAGTTTQASSLPLPFSLGGVSLTVTDSTGAQLPAPLIYVSPTQINFIVPAGTAVGAATFTVTNGGSNTSVTGNVQAVAPTLFSMNGSGSGVAAATAIRTQAGNPQFQFPVPVFTCTGSTCTSVPIDVGLDTPVYLTLYGTGIRSRSSLSNVRVTIHGISLPVLYAGVQPTFAGLDQVNVALTLNLRGSGESDVVLTVDGQTSNTVTVNIQ